MTRDLITLLALIAPEAIDRPRENHAHICGGDRDGRNGCGHRWSHESGDHHCPRCGEGPWTLRYRP